MKTIIIDNYDSFTYNLVQIVEKQTKKEPIVVKNDQFNLEEIKTFDKIILSPGPGIPSRAGKLMDVIKQYAPSKSILGVCLGQQAIGEIFGARLINMQQVYHGVATPISKINEHKIFNGCPDKFMVGRYHSWIIDKKTINDELVVTSIDETGLVMSIKHKIYDVHGVQFHPESILTEYGELIINNFLKTKT